MAARRAFLRLLALGALAPGAAVAWLRAARAAPIAVPDDPAEAMRSVLGDVRPTPGRVHLDVPFITETGTSVALGVKVDSPMTAADHVKEIHLFADGNPVPRILSVQIGPRAGRAELTTRVRLARSQTVTAVARMSDGSLWSDAREVIVAQGACVDDIFGTLEPRK